MVPRDFQNYGSLSYNFHKNTVLSAKPFLLHPNSLHYSTNQSFHHYHPINIQNQFQLKLTTKL